MYVHALFIVVVAAVCGLLSLGAQSPCVPRPDPPSQQDLELCKWKQWAGDLSRCPPE